MQETRDKHVNSRCPCIVIASDRRRRDCHSIRLEARPEALSLAVAYIQMPAKPSILVSVTCGGKRRRCDLSLTLDGRENNERHWCEWSGREGKGREGKRGVQLLTLDDVSLRKES